MSWHVFEQSFENYRDAIKEHGKHGYAVILEHTYPSIIEAREAARDLRGRGRILVPYRTTDVSMESPKAQKLSKEIQEIQKMFFEKVFNLYEKFQESRFRCGNCKSTVNMSFKKGGSFYYPFYLDKVEEGKYNIEAVGREHSDAFCCICGWRLMSCFDCPVCGKSDNSTARSVEKILFRTNKKIRSLQEKLFAEIAQSSKVKYLAVQAIHN